MSVLIPGLYGLDSYSAWRTFTKDPQKYIDRFAKDKTVQNEIDYFNKKAPTFKTVDDLLKDRRATQYLLDAYGLGSEINNLGRIKKILTEDPTASTSLAKRLADPRFAAMANSLRLDKGLDSLQRETFREVVQDKYIQNEFEEALGEQDPALRQAAYFARTASAGSISDVYNVLGDKILRDVMTTTFNIPPQLAIQPVETQAAALASRIDFTKFNGTGNTTVTAGQLARAKSDFTLLQTSLGISDKAFKQMTTLQTQLDQLAADYASLSAATDPSGANAALIAVQQTAVPELIRFEQLLQSGASAMDDVKQQLGSLNTLITEAQKSGADLNSLKTQFTAYVNNITSAINNATITAPDGSTQNMLTNGADDTLTVTIDDQGTQITINRFDATDIINSLNSAAASFNAVSSTSDTTNLYAAQGRLLIATDRATEIDKKITDDATSFAATLKDKPFYATLNTQALQKGSASVNDALDRLTKIEDLLDKIGALAKESKERTPSADRSDLETKFDDYRAQLRDLIADPGAAGLDNFLNNIGDQSYEISGGQSIHVQGGYDLLSTVADVIDAGSLSDQASAAALENSAITVTNATDVARAGLEKEKPILDHAYGLFDPRGRLDSQIYALKAGLNDFIAGAASSDGKNLLSSDQKDISLSLTTGAFVKLRTQPGFADDFAASLDSLITQLSSGDLNAIQSALSDTQYIADTTRRNIASDNRNGTLEMAKLGGLIDTLSPKDTSNPDNPYKINEFTEKFLLRYLTQSSLNSGTTTGANSYVLSLFGGGSNSGTSAISSIMSLSMKV